MPRLKIKLPSAPETSAKLETVWRRRRGPEDFRALTPLLHGHVNPYGTFELDMETRLPLPE